MISFRLVPDHVAFPFLGCRTVGTCCSIFVATPLLLRLYVRRPAGEAVQLA
jgi:hypothetical protein